MKTAHLTGIIMLSKKHNAHNEAPAAQVNDQTRQGHRNLQAI